MKRVKNRIFILLGLLTILTSGLQAQQREIARSTNGWFSMINEFRLSPKWFIYNEVHSRWADILNTKQQFLLRPGLGYQLNPNVDVFLGYSFVKTFPYGEQPVRLITPEHHLWQQVVVRQALAKLGIQHRYRLEERWVGRVVETANGVYMLDGKDYMNRFRYRLFLRVPLVTVEEGKKQLFAAGWNELFIHLDKDNFMPTNFNQNRFYLGFGYQFSAMGNIQLGFMDQVIRKGDLRYERNPTLNMALFYNINFYD